MIGFGTGIPIAHHQYLNRAVWRRIVHSVLARRCGNSLAQRRHIHPI
jgi:hypothetical protein